MRRVYRRTLGALSCLSCSVGVLVLFLILDIPSDQDDMWKSNGDDMFDSIWSLFPFFRGRRPQGLAKLNKIACYRYLPMEDERGNPQRYQLERPQADLEARNCRKRMPHALVIGVKKCGTTAMGKYMGLHPMLSFSRSVQPGPAITDATMEEWTDTFQLTSSMQMPFTGYPGLFNDMQPQLLQMVQKYLPDDIKLILMLRDPVQRLVSDYVHTSTIADRLKGEERKRYVEHEGLKSSLKATVLDEMGHVNPFASSVRLGLYAIDLRSLYQQIPEDRLLIIDGNSFSKDPFPSLLKVESFLQLPQFFKRFHFKYDKEKHFYCAHIASRPDMTCLSSQKGRKHPDIDDELVTKLYDFYRPHNQELRNDFGLNFSWIDL